MKNLAKWEYAENYCGEDYSDYFVGPSRHRDSQPLEESNFEAALERLGGETKRNVIVARSSHWAVGWVEQILVHKSAKAKLKILAEIKRDLEEYPVLDDDDFYSREREALDEYVADVYGQWDQVEQTKFIEAIMDLGLDYNDCDGSIYIRDEDAKAAAAHAGLKLEE